MKPIRKIMIVGNFSDFHIGAYFKKAAESLNLNAVAVDVREALSSHRLLNKLAWRLNAHLPPKVNLLDSIVIKKIIENNPNLILVTGLAPIRKRIIQQIKEKNIPIINYLTDDPFNPCHRTNWMMKSLPLYDAIFSPRKGNALDLGRIGCKKIAYLPFAYDPESHYPEMMKTCANNRKITFDVLFYGGADIDRVPMIKSLVRNGFQLALYGGGWNKYHFARPYFRGHADLDTLRKSIACSKVVIGLVRHCNRDGNSMRTFEAPAMKACFLCERTEDHLALFGEEGRNVMYFSNESEMNKKVRYLLNNKSERVRLSESAHELIVNGKHTYKDRLQSMLDWVEQSNG